LPCLSPDLKESSSRADGNADCTDESDSTSCSESEEERGSDERVSTEQLNVTPTETTYTENGVDMLTSSSGPLAEEFADENKNIIWCLMKQVSHDMI